MFTPSISRVFAQVVSGTAASVMILASFAPVVSAASLQVDSATMQGWSVLNYDAATASDVNGITSSGSFGHFVSGPGTPPAGTGSYEHIIGTNADDAPRLVTSAYNGAPLADFVTGLQYSTYVKSNMGAQASYIVLRISRDGTGTTTDRLFFEPVYQTGGYGQLSYSTSTIPNQCGSIPNCVALNTWQSWDASAGGWWSDQDSAGGPPLTTLADYLQQYPNARLATDLPAFRMQSGGGAGAWDHFRGSFDAVSVKGDIYNFEPTTLTAATQTVVVKRADLDPGPAATAVTSSSTKWFMYNDSTDVIDNTLGEFFTTTSAPAGLGAIRFTLAANPNDRKDIATYQFAATPLANITDLSFSAYSQSGVAGAQASPFMVMNVDFTGTNTWQKRLVYVPSANGSVAQDTWNTYDTLQGGSGKWTWSGYYANGNKWQDGNTNEYRTWDDILATWPHARILPAQGFMGVRVGDPGPTGYSGAVDKIIVGIQSGTTTKDIKTFDFEPSGNLSIVKNATGNNGTFTYNITNASSSTSTASVTTTLGTGSSTVTLAAGIYTISENVPANWKSAGVTCTSGSTTVATSTATSSTITVTVSDTDNAIACTFNNTWVEPPVSGGAPITVSGGGGATGGGTVLGTSTVATSTSTTGGTTGSGGTVLGTSTPPIVINPNQSACSASLLLNSYLRRGQRNPASEVIKLQTFLNANIAAGLPVTGYFGPLTDVAVRNFQKIHTQEVLTPWGISEPTGYVYKLTRWLINYLACPTSGNPKPQV